jgi:hypothetical protein
MPTSSGRAFEISASNGSTIHAIAATTAIAAFFMGVSLT